MAQRFNPPPNWPQPPSGWQPPADWQPDPAWGPAPPGWQLWVEDEGAKKLGTGPKVAIGVGVGLLGICLLGIVGAALDGGDDAAPKTVAAESASGDADSAKADASKKAADEAAAKAKAEEEAKKQAEADAEAKRKAEAEAKEKAEAEAKAKAEAQAKAKQEAAQKDPKSYKAIEPRTLSLIAKDPDAHAGEKYVIYGYVTQFDAATGPDIFRADTAAKQYRDWYEYEHNSVIEAPDASMLKDVVADDIVKMHVEVVGSMSYDTQIGGSTTVPHFKVNIISVVGSGK